MSHFTVSERLWLSKCRTKLVPDGHVDAAILFAPKGSQISEEDAVKFGLVRLPEKAAEKEGDKAKPKAQNKAKKGGLKINRLPKDE